MSEEPIGDEEETAAEPEHVASEHDEALVEEWEDESFPIEMPTSGGCRDSDTSEPTVSPKRSPSTAAVTTATGAGKRRITSRSSSPFMRSMIWA